MSGKYGLLRLSCNRMTTESFYRYEGLIWLGLQGGKRSPEHKTAPQGVLQACIQQEIVGFAPSFLGP
jgi:hypothetical protein